MYIIIMGAFYTDLPHSYAVANSEDEAHQMLTKKKYVRHPESDGIDCKLYIKENTRTGFGNWARVQKADSVL